MTQRTDVDARLREAAALKADGRLAQAADLLAATLRTATTARPALFRELADVAAKRGSFTRACDYIDAGLAEAGSNTGARAPLLERRAWIYFRQGKLAQAREIAQTLIDELDERHHSAVLADTWNTVGGIAWQEGRLNDAIAAVGRAASLYERVGDRRGAANARTNLGVLYFTTGIWKLAAEHFSESDKLRRDIGWNTGRASNLKNLGLLEAALGRHPESRRHLEESLRLSLSAEEWYDVAQAEIALAHLSLIENRLDDACRHLDSALSRQDCICDDDLVQASWLKALIECDRGGAERGAEIAAEAREKAQQANLVESEADCCRALGIAYCRCNRWDDAERSLREAITLSERAADPYRRALATLELGQLFADTQRGDWRNEVRRNADEASELFEQLGASYDLQRARDLGARAGA